MPGGEAALFGSGKVKPPLPEAGAEPRRRMPRLRRSTRSPTSPRSSPARRPRGLGGLDLRQLVLEAGDLGRGRSPAGWPWRCGTASRAICCWTRPTRDTGEAVALAQDLLGQRLLALLERAQPGRLGGHRAARRRAPR